MFEIFMSCVKEELKEEIYNALPSGHRKFIAQRHENIQDMGNNVEFPKLIVSPAIKEHEEEVADSILSIQTPQFCSFKSMSKKVMYNMTVKTMHQDSLESKKFQSGQIC